MTHFIALAVARPGETVEGLLAPYSETLEVEPYLDGGELTTYNPRSIWDWWVIGGRWSGAFYPEDHCSVATFVADIEASKHQHLPRIVFDRDGTLERGEQGWFGYTANNHDEVEWRGLMLRRLREHDPEELVVFLDLHI